MIRYNQFSNRFLAPDQGGPSGGTGNPGANQGGASNVDDGSATALTDPTAGLNLDDYDPATRKILEDARKGFATLQKNNEDLAKAKTQEEIQRKQFQSNYDQVKAEFDKLTAGKQSQEPSAKDKQLALMTGILAKRGVPAEQAKVQAEIMVEMMGEFGNQLKQEIGAGLTPMAHQFTAREAEFAWGSAVHNDKIGAMQIDEVAKEAWAQVETLVQQGQQVTQGTVENLVGMAYFKHLNKGGKPADMQQQQQQQQQVPQFLQMGRLTYPGAGAAPARPNPTDPNAARYPVDADTDAAVQAVLAKWAEGTGGVKAPGFRPPVGRSFSRK